MSDQITILPFLAPWYIPGILAGIDLYCHLETGFGLEQHYPRAFAEAIACGIPVLLSHEIASRFTRLGSRDDAQSLLVVAPESDPGGTAEMLALVMDSEQ